MVPSVRLNQQAALRHVGFIQRFSEIEHRGEGDILVTEPGNPFIASFCGKGFAQEGNQRGLRRAGFLFRQSDQVWPVQRVRVWAACGTLCWAHACSMAKVSTSPLVVK